MKLTAPQRNGIICAAFDEIIYYDRSGTSERGWFWKIEYQNRYETPRMNNATAVGFALLARDIIVIPEHPVNGSCHVILTELGKKLFDEHATSAEKINLERKLSDDQNAAKQKEIDRKLEEKREANKVELKAIRDKNHEDASKLHRLKSEYNDISWKLGGGANNVDELIALLRKLRLEITALEASLEVRRKRFDELHD